ncbi:ribonuclease, partial [Roseomonas alkaliterrae]|nr:ribonuclease [Neoroseomonas alkaliterrae]
RLALRAAPAVIAALEGASGALAAFADLAGTRLALVPDPALSLPVIEDAPHGD